MKKNASYLIVALVLALVLGVAFFYQNRQPERDEPASMILSESASNEVFIPSDESEKLRWPETRAQEKKTRRAYSLEAEDRVVVPEGKALDVIAGLRPRAEAGDAKAALVLHMKLDDCYNAFNKEITDKQVAMFDEAGATGLLEGRLQDLEDCAGVESLLGERGKWLEQAADAGLLEAQLLYAIDPEPLVGDASEMIRDPQKVQRYKAKAAEYLNHLAAGGNIDAMMILARSYSNGIMMQRDATRSYAYYRAVDLARPGLIPDRLLSARRSQVPVEQQGQAEELAQNLYRKCCRQ